MLYRSTMGMFLFHLSSDLLLLPGFRRYINIRSLFIVSSDLICADSLESQLANVIFLGSNHVATANIKLSITRSRDLGNGSRS